MTDGGGGAPSAPSFTLRWPTPSEPDAGWSPASPPGPPPTGRVDVRGARLARWSLVFGIVIAVVFSLAVILVVVVANRASKHSDYARLRVGDCYNLTGGGYVDRVACGRPHHAEVTGSFQLARQGAFPGAAGFQAEAEPKCQAMASGYLGSSTRIDLGFVWITPQRSAWDAGTRTVVCGLQNADRTPRTGSLRT